MKIKWDEVKYGSCRGVFLIVKINLHWESTGYKVSFHLGQNSYTLNGLAADLTTAKDSAERYLPTFLDKRITELQEVKAMLEKKND